MRCIFWILTMMTLSLCLVAAILTTLIIPFVRSLERNASSIIRMVPVPPVPDPAAKHTQRLRRLAVQAEELLHRPHRSYMDETAYYTDFNEEQKHRRLLKKPAGTFYNLVLLIRFSNHANRQLPSRIDISRLYNYVGRPPLADNRDSIVPTGSVRQFYESNSYNKFTIRTTVSDWITLSKPESYYSSSNNGFTKFREAIVEALDKIDHAAGGFNFSLFDHNKDGSLDGFGVLHSGYGAEYAGKDCEGVDSEDRIWSHKGGLTSAWKPLLASESKIVNVQQYYASSSLSGVCGSNIVRMGVIVHEIGHYIGLPDLYDETFHGAGLGAYDFMSQSWGWDGTGTFPPTLCAWSKSKLGWTDIQVIEKDGSYQLKSSATSNIVYKIIAGYPTGEYLLIENRQPIGYDRKMNGKGGLAIYHIDDKADGQSHRGYPSQSNWPRNGQHYQVALLPADGVYDLEQDHEYKGGEADLWHSGSAKKMLGSGWKSYPNTDSYQNGNIKATGVKIYGFGKSGKIMTFKVDGLDKSVVAGAGVAVSLNQAPKNAPRSPLHPTPSAKQPGLKSMKPVTKVTLRCTNYCFDKIPSTQCPLQPWDLPNCSVVDVGELCDSSGECGLSQILNNCFLSDVYRRIACNLFNTELSHRTEQENDLNKYGK